VHSFGAGVIYGSASIWTIRRQKGGWLVMIIWKGSGSGRVLVEGLSRHLFKGTKENHKSLSRDSRCTHRDSNRAAILLPRTCLIL
jgi:hypothetical protein